jgi:hypothetical protein
MERKDEPVVITVHRIAEGDVTIREEDTPPRPTEPQVDTPPSPDDPRG